MARKKATATKDEVPPLPPLGEVLSGRFDGIQTSPYERWEDAKWIGKYSPRCVPIKILKLMREDPQLSLGLAAYRGPFFGTSYEVVGGDPVIRAFVRSVFVDTPLMVRALETVLNALDYGFSAHEVMWGFQDVTFDPDGKGGAPPVTMPLSAVILEANDIDPERVTPVVDDRDRLLGYRIDGGVIGQSLDVATIPVEKTLHAVHSMEHRNWRGRSLLKRAYKPWWWAELVGLFMSRWYERKADPPYHGTAPPEPRPNPKTGEMQNPLEVMKKLLLALAGSGVIMTPHEPDAITKQNKWSIRELTDGGRAGEFVTGLAYLDALKLRGLTVPEEIATRGSVGSQAKTETVLGVFLQALETVKRTLVIRTIEEGVIRPLVRFNFGRSASAPRLESPEFNHDQKDLLGQLLMAMLQVPLELEDGRKYRPIDLPMIERILRQLGIPYREATEVARAASSPTDPQAPVAGDPPGEAAAEGEAPAQ